MLDKGSSESSNANGRQVHLGILLKCGFWFSLPGSLRLCASNKLLRPRWRLEKEASPCGSLGVTRTGVVWVLREESLAGLWMQLVDWRLGDPGPRVEVGGGAKSWSLLRLEQTSQIQREAGSCYVLEFALVPEKEFCPGVCSFIYSFISSTNICTLL